MIIILIPVTSAVTIGLSKIKTTGNRMGNVKPTHNPIKIIASFTHLPYYIFSGNKTVIPPIREFLISLSCNFIQK